MESIGQTGIELSTVVAVVVFGLGLVVGIGGMWLAWRIVRGLPPDEADHPRTPSDTDDDLSRNPPSSSPTDEPAPDREA